MAGKFNLDNYITVDERIHEFWGLYPGGRIHTEVCSLDEDTDTKRMVVIRAEVYKNASDAHPTATGYAKEREGLAGANQTAFLENCETSAIGRALATLGLLTERGRPSREEMGAVQAILDSHEDAIQQIKAFGAASDDAALREKINQEWSELKRNPLAAIRFLDSLNDGSLVNAL